MDTNNNYICFSITGRTAFSNAVPGMNAEPFVPLSHWLTSGFAPLVLAVNFGGMLVAWASLCVALGVVWLVAVRRL